jgi:hypothetical protein
MPIARCGTRADASKSFVGKINILVVENVQISTLDMREQECMPKIYPCHRMANPDEQNGDKTL